jgi:hypothetical protein
VKGDPVEKKTAVPSKHFSQATMEALARAGTVMLPYPPPASGLLCIGINPDYQPHLPGGSPKFFLRLVQIVSPKQVIIRIVDLNELRAISRPAASTKEGKTSREFRTVNEIAKEIEEATESLTRAEGTERGVYEVLLFEDAVIFIRESAPVVIQIQYEFGVTAGESAENVDQMAIHGKCYCPDSRPVELP